jgi:hypothetical protein
MPGPLLITGETMKVVINKCYGGFGLSCEGMMRYAELKGLTLYPKGDGLYTIYWTVSPKDRVTELSNEAFYALPRAERIEYNRKFSEQTLHAREIARDDPALVQVVEELDDKANGRYAELAVVEIPDDVKWQIEEYDGLEHIAEAHRVWS